MPKLIIKPETTYNEQRTLNIEIASFSGTPAAATTAANTYIAGLPAAKNEDVFIDAIRSSQHGNNYVLMVHYGWWTG